MKLKELRNTLNYCSIPIRLIVMHLDDDTDTKIEYENFKQFNYYEDFNEFKVTSILASQYSIDIYVAKEGG